MSLVLWSGIYSGQMRSTVLRQQTYAENVFLLAPTNIPQLQSDAVPSDSAAEAHEKL